MSIALRHLAASAALLASLSTAAMAVPAVPAPSTETMTVTMPGDNLVPVRYRGRGFGWGIGAGIAGGIVAGALLAPRYYGPRAYYEPYYYAPPPPPPRVYYDAPGDDAVAYCMQRFRSYDPRTGTYLGYDGYRHPCP